MSDRIPERKPLRGRDRERVPRRRLPEGTTIYSTTQDIEDVEINNEEGIGVEYVESKEEVEVEIDEKPMKPKQGILKKLITFFIIIGVVLGVSAILLKVFMMDKGINNTDRSYIESLEETVTVEETVEEMSEDEVEETSEETTVEETTEQVGQYDESQLTLTTEGTLNILVINVFKDSGELNNVSLLSLGKERGIKSVISLPAETVVELNTDKKRGMLSEAYQIGGVDKVKETVGLLYQIQIDKYMLIDEDIIGGVLDNLGGVKVTPNITLKGEGYEYNGGAEVTLDKAKLTPYMKDKSGGMAKYQERMSGVLDGFLKAILVEETPLRYKDVYNKLKEQGELGSDMSFEDLMFIQENYVEELKQLSKSVALGKPTDIEGVYYYMIDLDYLVEMRAKFAENVNEQQPTEQPTEQAPEQPSSE